MNVLAKGAYDVIMETNPQVIETVKKLLQAGETSKQITDKIARQDVFLAGLVEMAIDYIENEQ